MEKVWVLKDGSFIADGSCLITVYRNENECRNDWLNLVKQVRENTLFATEDYSCCGAEVKDEDCFHFCYFNIKDKYGFVTGVKTISYFDAEIK